MKEDEKHRREMKMINWHEIRCGTLETEAFEIFQSVTTLGNPVSRKRRHLFYYIHFFSWIISTSQWKMKRKEIRNERMNVEATMLFHGIYILLKDCCCCRWTRIDWKLYEKLFKVFSIYFISKSYRLDGIKECMVEEKVCR